MTGLTLDPFLFYVNYAISTVAKKKEKQIWIVIMMTYVVFVVHLFNVSGLCLTQGSIQSRLKQQ